LLLKEDCSYFFGDRPCDYHKKKGIKCDDCEYYSPINFKILIIKLDAMGDVLRTTSILPPLKIKYEDSHITWCTRKESIELLRNEYIDELIAFEDDAVPRLLSEKFDLIINFDSSKRSSALAALAKGVIRKGFVLDEKGFVMPTSDAARQWLSMSAFDDYKISNQKSYQEIIYNILDLDSEIALPVIQLKEKKTYKKFFINKFKIDNNKLTIGLNTGVGNKWTSKGWPYKRWEELLILLKNVKCNVLLLGGSAECEQNKQLAKKFVSAMNTGCENSVAEFAHIVNLCDLIVTCDTFALHVATAFKKKIVALFGPTSMNEIYLYGNGIKVKAESDCKCYYEKNCKESVSCMENISSVLVFNTIKELL